MLTEGVYVILIDMYTYAKVFNRQYLHSSNNYALHNAVNICIYKYTLAVFRYYALPGLKIYRIRNVNYRFSVLAMYIGTRLLCTGKTDRSKICKGLRTNMEYWVSVK